MRIILTFLALTLCGTLAANSPLSNNRLDRTERMVSFVPQYLLVNGLRVDYDLRLNKNSWMQMAPMAYFRLPSDTDSYPGVYYTSQVGGGLHLYHRYYTGEGFGISPVYISYGPVYQFYHFTYNEGAEGQEVERYSQVQRVGADIIIGVYTNPWGFIALDLYIGMGIRHSFVSSNAVKPQKFDSSYWSWGYSGNILTLGVRICYPLGIKN